MPKTYQLAEAEKRIVELEAEVEQLKHDASNAEILRDVLTETQSHAADLAGCLTTLITPSEMTVNMIPTGRDREQLTELIILARAALAAWNQAQGNSDKGDGDGY